MGALVDFCCPTAANAAAIVVMATTAAEQQPQRRFAFRGGSQGYRSRMLVDGIPFFVIEADLKIKKLILSRSYFTKISSLGISSLIPLFP